MSRKHYSTRWDVDNVQVQCYSCNVMRYGEQYKFGLYLEKTYQKGMAEKLQSKSRIITKFSDVDLIDMINDFNKLLTDLK